MAAFGKGVIVIQRQLQDTDLVDQVTDYRLGAASF